MDLGDQFAGYRIEALVGRGGMGVVYRATQLDLGRTVALKVIAPETLSDEAARGRFVSEARHAASIEHPHVVPSHAAGEIDGTAYFVMRFVEGDDLRTRCAVTGRSRRRRRPRSCSARGLRWTRSTAPGWCIVTSSRRTSCWPTATMPI